MFHANVADATFNCSLDFGAFAPCTSPKTYTDLAPGEHMLQIIATDPEGGYAEMEADRVRVVHAPDRRSTPPDTTITVATERQQQRVTFEFTGTDNVTSPAALTSSAAWTARDEADSWNASARSTCSTCSPTSRRASTPSTSAPTTTPMPIDPTPHWRERRSDSGDLQLDIGG